MFDPQNQWPREKRPAELQIREYDAELKRPQLVVVPQFTGFWRQREEFRKFVLLIDQVRRGSTVLFLGIPSDGPAPFHQRRFASTCNFSCMTTAAVLGFTLREDGDNGRRKVGQVLRSIWLVSRGQPKRLPGDTPRHFQGLPGPGLMDWEYGNIVSGEVAVPFRMSAEDTGPDLPICTLDNGKVAFCTYELLDHFERDGIAEKLFSNIVGYLHGQLPSELSERSERRRVWLQYHQEQVQDCWDKFLSKSESS